MSKTKSTNKFINTIDACLTNGVKNGIFQVSLEDETLNGRAVTIDGRCVVNFGSCSYLGLGVDERLKQGAIDATQRYRTQYSSSRLFFSCNLYEDLVLPRVGYNMVKRLLNEGFYTNIGIFPGVLVKCCGLRLAVTNGQAQDDINILAAAFIAYLSSHLKTLKPAFSPTRKLRTNGFIHMGQSTRSYLMLK